MVGFDFLLYRPIDASIPWMLTVDGYAEQSQNRVVVSPFSQNLQGKGATGSKVRIWDPDEIHIY